MKGPPPPVGNPIPVNKYRILYRRTGSCSIRHYRWNLKHAFNRVTLWASESVRGTETFLLLTVLEPGVLCRLARSYYTDWQLSRLWYLLHHRSVSHNVYMYEGEPKIPEFLKELFGIVMQVWNFCRLQSAVPCDWMQRSQCLYPYLERCLKSSTQMLSRDISNPESSMGTKKIHQERDCF